MDLIKRQINLFGGRKLCWHLCTHIIRKVILKINFRLHDYNQQRASDSQINIKGFAVGNGCTDVSEC